LESAPTSILPSTATMTTSLFSLLFFLISVWQVEAVPILAIRGRELQRQQIYFILFYTYSYSRFYSSRFLIVYISLFFLQESRLIENYEQVVKDLENKLDLSHEKYRQLVEEHRYNKRGEIRETILERFSSKIFQSFFSDLGWRKDLIFFSF
jgi:hypothetical protein